MIFTPVYDQKKQRNQIDIHFSYGTENRPTRPWETTSWTEFSDFDQVIKNRLFTVLERLCSRGKFDDVARIMLWSEDESMRKLLCHWQQDREWVRIPLFRVVARPNKKWMESWEERRRNKNEE